MRDDWTTYHFVIYHSWIAFNVTTQLASGPHPARFSAFDVTLKKKTFHVEISISQI